MSALTDFFLKSKASVVELQTFVISHSNFSQSYYIVRNSTRAINLTDETNQTHEYLCYPAAISFQTVRDDLDQILTIQFGDLGEVIPAELRRVKAANGFSEYPKLVYRTWRSDDTTAVLTGPIVLELRHFDLNRRGAIFEARAPLLNVSRTGERYQIARFPQLTGLVQ